MSDQEVIAARIQTALDRSWQPRFWEDGEGNVHTDTIVAFDVYKYGMRKVTFFTDDAIRFHLPVWDIIFNHDFANALWGEEGTTIEGLRCSADEGVTPFWAHHLQRMVIANDPIRYLGDNI